MNSTASEDNNAPDLNLSFGCYKFKPLNNDISKGEIRRLCFKAGGRRITKQAIIHVPVILRAFLTKHIIKSIHICTLQKRKVVSRTDMLYALKSDNITFRL